jgi:outer membrane protein TolC
LDGPPSLPLDFATALGLTQAQNPRIAFRQAQIAQAYAQNRAAQVLWLPSLRAGVNYNKHEGRIQDVIGSNIETSRGAMYGGLGAAAVGAASPAIPGLYLQFHTTDAIFQRQITGFALSARQAQGTAAINDQLLETSLAYLALLEAMQRKSIAVETLQHGQALVDLTANYAQTGAGNLADADRAAAAAALLRNEVVRADEAVLVASARVAQQLSADPSILIVPQEPTVVPIDLLPPEVAAADLVATGLSNRPELAASRNLVNEAVSRLQREKHAPWLPSIVLGVSYGAFGAGRGGNIDHTADRLDMDAVAWWEVRNLGFGESAARANASAQIQQARMREVETMDLVAREIVEASTQVTARRKQIDVAKEGITSAQQSYDRNLERIRNVQGLPIEVLQAIQALDGARREYLRVSPTTTRLIPLAAGAGWPVSPPADSTLPLALTLAIGATARNIEPGYNWLIRYSRQVRHNSYAGHAPAHELPRGSGIERFSRFARDWHALEHDQRRTTVGDLVACNHYLERLAAARSGWLRPSIDRLAAGDLATRG